MDFVEIKDEIKQHGVESLILEDLLIENLDSLRWSGSEAHLESIAKELARVPGGEVEYLVLRASHGEYLSKGAIDYSAHENSGYMYQLATQKELQGLGIGTRLINEMEKRIISRSFGVATVGVEVENTRAKNLYEKLGYVAYGKDQESWYEINSNGKKYLYKADITLMNKLI